MGGGKALRVLLQRGEFALKLSRARLETGGSRARAVSAFFGFRTAGGARVQLSSESRDFIGREGMLEVGPQAGQLGLQLRYA
jgi:hypothetical protein